MPKQTILDLSTEHMRYADSLILGGYDDGRPLGASVIVDSNDYGWTVSTSTITAAKADGHLDETVARMREEGLSQEFVDLLVKAESEGCVSVRFDQDADHDEDYPHFDWEEERSAPPSSPSP